jgi:hypothetical protein
VGSQPVARVTIKVSLFDAIGEFAQATDAAIAIRRAAGELTRRPIRPQTRQESIYPPARKRLAAAIETLHAG